MTDNDDKADRGPVENNEAEPAIAQKQREVAQEQPGKRGVGRPFPKGVSGNPGGRPKVVAEMKRELEAGGIPAVKKLVEFIEHEDAKIAITAAKDVIDRIMGKPRNAEDDAQRSLLAAFFAGMQSRMGAAQAQAEADEAEDGEDDA